MAVCPVCGGVGGSHGDRVPCGNCAGRGYAMTIHTPCNACGGSGHSSQRYWNACYGCGGSGHIADAVPGVVAPSRPSKRAPGRPAEPWRRSHLVVAAVAYGLIVAYLIEGQGMSGWPPFAVAALPALVIGKQWKGLLAFGAFVAGLLALLYLLMRSGWLAG